MEPPPAPPPPRISRREELVLLVLVGGFAILALVLPISADAVLDTARALHLR